MRQEFHVGGLGEILWDLLPGGKQLGGAPANFAYHAQALGARSHIISSVGSDPLGREILEALESNGLSSDGIAVHETLPSGTVDVTLDSDGKPDFIIHQQVAWDSLVCSDALRDLASELSAVCFGALAQRSPVTRATVRDLLRTTSPSCLRVFDVNLRQDFYTPDIVLESLELSTCLKLNEDELQVVARICGIIGGEDEIIRTLVDRFDLGLVALTRGERGSLLVTGGEANETRSPEVAVADTVGAGDAFTAALTMGLLQDLPLGVINQQATALAGYVCTQPGAMPQIPEEIRLMWRG
jgi:fructokinase